MGGAEPGTAPTMNGVGVAALTATMLPVGQIKSHAEALNIATRLPIEVIDVFHQQTRRNACFVRGASVSNSWRIANEWPERMRISAISGVF
jgi:hypothetical protein